MNLIDQSNEIIFAISILFILSVGIITGIYKSFYRYSNFLDLIKISISSIINCFIILALINILTMT